VKERMEIEVEIGKIDIYQDQTKVFYWAFGNHDVIERTENNEAKRRDTNNRIAIARATYSAGEEQDETEEIRKEIEQEIEYRLSQVRRVFPQVTTNDIDLDSFLGLIVERFPERDC